MFKTCITILIVQITLVALALGERAVERMEVNPEGVLEMDVRRHFLVWGFLLIFTLVLSARTEAIGYHVNARSAILVDTSDGRILYEQNADTPIPPASITKIITLYLVFDAIRNGEVHPSDRVIISSRAASMSGSRMGVRTGQEVPLEELIKGMAVVSGNDACIAVAEHLGGSVEEFVRRMNQKARELGMEHTHFVNPNGLPADGQLTTARDISRLSMAYLRRFPESLSIHSTQAYTFNRATHHNANRLLGTCQGVDGIKTGFVCAAGYNISATAKRDDVRLLAVVLGSRTPGLRLFETARLIEVGFHMISSGSSEPSPLVQARLINRTVPCGDSSPGKKVRYLVRKTRGGKRVSVALISGSGKRIKVSRAADIRNKRRSASSVASPASSSKLKHTANRAGRVSVAKAAVTAKKPDALCKAGARKTVGAAKAGTTGKLASSTKKIVSTAGHADIRKVSGAQKNSDSAVSREKQTKHANAKKSRGDE